MDILAIEPNGPALESLTETIKEAAPGARVHAFADGEAAYDFARTSKCDVAFIETGAAGTGGNSLARRLKEIYPRIDLIFLTDEDHYSIEALGLRGSGYLKKPLTKEMAASELGDLRYPVLEEGEPRVRVKTFGFFEIYVDDRPVSFTHEKTKEFIAYLIDRDALCTNSEVASALWESKVDKSYIRILRKDLNDTFREISAPNILYHVRGRQCIRKDLITCDYYDWKYGLPGSAEAYNGEYMTQYTWAETTHAILGKASAEEES